MITTMGRDKLSTEEMVRAILSAPETMPMAEIARRVGISRQAARMIRYGQTHRGVLPELPRSILGTGSRRCWKCKLAIKHQVGEERVRHGKRGEKREVKPWCSLGYPESIDATYARECPVFEPLD